MKVWRNKAEQTVKVKLGTYPNTAEAAEGNTEPDEPKDLGGNVDLKQLGLSVKPGPGKDGGVVISDVDPNSDAALKGIKEGDIVLKAGNEAVYFAAGRGQGREEGPGRRSPRRHVPHQEERRPDGSDCHPAQQELSRIPSMNDLAARTLGLRVRAASTFGVARGTMRIEASGLDNGGAVTTMHVLVVEDDRETAHFLQKALKESGHAADLAEDGETGHRWPSRASTTC